LGKPEIAAQAAATRAKTPEARKFWEKIAMALHKSKEFAILAGVGLLVGMAPPPVNAKQVEGQAGKFVLCKL
jgi:hypothetical protein